MNQPKEHHVGLQHHQDISLTIQHTHPALFSLHHLLIFTTKFELYFHNHLLDDYLFLNRAQFWITQQLKKTNLHTFCFCSFSLPRGRSYVSRRLDAPSTINLEKNNKLVDKKPYDRSLYIYIL